MNRPWRVAIVRDGDNDALIRELTDHGFDAAPCPVMREESPADPARLRAAALALDTFDWLVVASTRSVEALVRARSSAWPPDLRTAAVGHRTAAALVAAGAVCPPVVATQDGADALLARLLDEPSWRDVRVLCPTVDGGRRMLIEGLRDAGAIVEEVEAYRTTPLAPRDVSSTWTSFAPDAAIVGSGRSAQALIGAIGSESLRQLRCLLVVGRSTEAAFDTAGIATELMPRADYRSAATHLASVRDRVMSAVERDA
jgi:uroporphyrinogen-III synthase